MDHNHINNTMQGRIPENIILISPASSWLQEDLAHAKLQRKSTLATGD